MTVQKTFNIDLNAQDIKIKEILSTKDFLLIEVWAISDAYPNNNESHFPLDTFETSIQNKVFEDKPILGKWNGFNQDYEEHNSKLKKDPEYKLKYQDYNNGEVPIGVIREQDEVKIVEKDGLNWIVFTAVLWVKYGYEGVKKLLKSKTKKVSVEISILKSHTDENGIEILDEWIFDGVTILGNYANTKIPAKEGIEGAHLTILEKLEDETFVKQIKNIKFAYNELHIDGEQSILYIEKNDKEECKLTYEQKRKILETYLYENKPDEDWYAWITDISDDGYAIVNICGEYYKVYFSIDAESKEVNMKLDEKEKVMSTWTTFAKEEIEIEGHKYDIQALFSKHEDLTNKITEVESLLKDKEKEIENLSEQFAQKEDNSEKDKDSSETEEDFKEEDNSEKDKDGSETEEDFKEETNSEEDNEECQNCIAMKEEFIKTKETLEQKEKECSDFANKISEYTKTIEKWESKFAEQTNLELSKQAEEISFKLELSDDVTKKFVEKCINGEYSSLEMLIKDITYEHFISTQEDKKDCKNFSGPIEPIEGEKINSLKSIEKLKKLNEI